MDWVKTPPPFTEELHNLSAFFMASLRKQEMY